MIEITAEERVELLRKFIANANVDSVIFNDDGAVVILSSCWSKDSKPEELINNDAALYVDDYSERVKSCPLRSYSVKAREIEKWHILSSPSDLQGNLLAFCNWNHLFQERLLEELRQPRRIF